MAVIVRHSLLSCGFQTASRQPFVITSLPRTLRLPISS